MTFDETDFPDSIDPKLLRAVQPQEQGLVFQPDVERAWQRMEMGALAPQKVGFGNNLRRWAPYLIAAGLVVGAVAIKYVPIQSASQWSWKAGSESHKTYSTLPGQRARIRLGDGTEIILNSASQLHVPENFGKVSRTLTLEGEAQFTVVHNPNKPFLINANGTSIRDLATTFVVRAYSAGEPTRVAVWDGRVSVQSHALTESRAVVLNAGQLATVPVDGRPAVSSMTDSDPYFAWATGKLVLIASPLGEALAELHRWYGVEFRAADPALLTLNVTTVLPEQLDRGSIEEMADVIGARVQWSGKTVTFVSKTVR